MEVPSLLSIPLPALPAPGHPLFQLCGVLRYSPNCTFSWCCPFAYSSCSTWCELTRMDFASKIPSRCLHGLHPFLELKAPHLLGSSKRMTSVQLSGLLRTVPAASSPNLGAESSLPLPIAWDSPYFSTCNAELKPFLICIPLSDRAQTLVLFIH